MEIVLTGVAIWLLTELTKYITKATGKQVSTKLVVVLLSLIAGSVYYYFQQTNPALIEEAIKFCTGAFASSQVLWMMLEKFFASKEYK